MLSELKSAAGVLVEGCAKKIKIKPHNADSNGYFITYGLAWF
ncbi:MAG: hypothetical protein ACJA0C_000881 [Candidatus Endobugula sp.]|jgi:hypothetical protein